jgi:hypothetical protein
MRGFSSKVQLNGSDENQRWAVILADLQKLSLPVKINLLLVYFTILYEKTGRL